MRAIEQQGIHLVHKPLSPIKMKRGAISITVFLVCVLLISVKCKETNKLSRTEPTLEMLKNNDTSSNDVRPKEGPLFTRRLFIFSVIGALLSTILVLLFTRACCSRHNQRGNIQLTTI